MGVKAAPQKMVSRKTVLWRLYGIIALAVLCLLTVFPTYANQGIKWVNQKANLGLPVLPDRGFSLGLDLQGGAHLIYQAQVGSIPESERTDAVEGVRDVIERRVRGGLGVSEPLVQTTRVGEDYRVIVELPGIKDVQKAIAMIGETPVLEFKEENTEPPRQLTPEEKKQLDQFNADAKKKAQEALNKVKQGTDFAAVVSHYSDDAASKLNQGNLGFIDERKYLELYNWAKTAKDGEASKDLVQSDEGFNIVQRLSSRDGEKQVRAAHILICYRGAVGCTTTDTKEQARTKIEGIKARATPQNFGDLAAAHSTEPNADTTNGDLGSFKRAEVVGAFGDVAFSMTTGTISDIVETDFGYHIIYKKGEIVSTEYEVARVLVKTKKPTDIVPPADEWKATGLSGKQLKRASVVQDPQTGMVQVSLQFNDEGNKLFSDLTQRNLNKPVAIFLDGEPISIPVVSDVITTGNAVIQGNFTLQEARLLSQRLNAGALPVAIDIIGHKQVDARLGADSLQKSLKAGLYGLLAVMIFMVLYYRLPGLLSVLSLAFYAVLSLALFKLLGVTLTLSGIAGFILSIGMAVDANILVFERLKEELAMGKSLMAATEEAFVRSWPSIRDSHITTLISAFFLIWLGTGFIEGFAIVLVFGTLINLFTAITVTRTIMRVVFPLLREKGKILFLGYRQ